tara:strand:+ start:1450 stop:2271 length:822 start_codon:yes stop_codon:yes gene_type:complete
MISSIKYQLINKIEKIPFLQIFIYNNLYYLKMLLPHDKDYHALKILFKKNEKRLFVDVGGNIGLSTAGWRLIGFQSNKILVFEPDIFLVKKYLKKIKLKFKNIKIYNFGLSNTEKKRNFYRAFYKNKFFHFNNSFDLDYIKKKLRNNYPNLYKKFKITKSSLKLKKFDNLKIKSRICFIKIDVEGYDHLVIEGMKNTIKRDFPIILSEYNKENFFKIYKLLKKKYFCYSYLYDENIFKRFNDNEIKNLINGRYKLEKYSKNSINIFFMPKNKI